MMALVIFMHIFQAAENGKAGIQGERGPCHPADD